MIEVSIVYNDIRIFIDSIILIFEISKKEKQNKKEKIKKLKGNLFAYFMTKLHFLFGGVKPPLYFKILRRFKLWLKNIKNIKLKNLN